MHHDRVRNFPRTAALVMAAVALATGPTASRGAEIQTGQSNAAMSGKSSASTPAQVSKKNGDAPGSGKSAAQEGGSGTKVSEKSFGAWTLQCLSDPSITPHCQIMHRLASPDSNQVVLVMSVASLSKDKTGLQLALPLGFAIQAGVKIAFGSKYSTGAAVSRCTVQGCIVEGTCPPEMIAAMKREKDGSVTVKTMQGNDIKLAVSLDGFADAYKAMEAKNNSPAG